MIAEIDLSDMITRALEEQRPLTELERYTLTKSYEEILEVGE